MSEHAEAHAVRQGLPPLPPQMKELPIDPRGFPVPWFVSKHGGTWDFQAVEPGKIVKAFTDKTCWLCGKALFRNLAFVIGPMCAITRTSSEPPSHCECASFAVKACPFLTKPRMRRLPRLEEHQDPGGIMLERNPGVSLIWVARDYFHWLDRGGRMLFTVGDPVRIEAWAEGRRATDQELEASISSGLPELERLAHAQDEEEGGTEAMAELMKQVAVARKIMRLPELAA